MTHRLHLPDGLDPARFLESVWQRRPLLMRDALPGFRSPLTADALAELACAPDVESRIVLEHGARPWEVRHGPFEPDTFAALPESHWTLLAQDVDKHVPAVAELLDAFDFLPHWRLDDIAIGWAEDQGSVGPHTDEHDVFLIQAQGQRRWRIDPQPRPGAPCLPDLELRILADFEPREQWLLAPGDVLYLPPGVPHWGIAEGPCMTWEVSLRAPDWQDLALAWCESAVPDLLPRARWRDPDPHPPRHRGEIPRAVTAEIRERIERALTGADERTFAAWLGTFLTEPKEHLTPLPRDTATPPAAFAEAFERAGALLLGPSRLLYTALADGSLLLFAGGEVHPVPCDCADLAVLLTDRAVLEHRTAAPWLDRTDCLALLSTLYDRGHCDFPD